jgi:hypothetical protein
MLGSEMRSSSSASSPLASPVRTANSSASGRAYSWCKKRRASRGRQHRPTARRRPGAGPGAGRPGSQRTSRARATPRTSRSQPRRSVGTPSVRAHARRARPHRTGAGRARPRRRRTARLEQLPNDAEGRVPLELGGARPQHLKVSRRLRRRGEKARLAYPRWPLDDDGSPSPPRAASSRRSSDSSSPLALHARRRGLLHTRIVRLRTARSGVGAAVPQAAADAGATLASPGP